MVLPKKTIIEQLQVLSSRIPVCTPSSMADLPLFTLIVWFACMGVLIAGPINRPRQLTKRLYFVSLTPDIEHAHCEQFYTDVRDMDNVLESITRHGGVDRYKIYYVDVIMPVRERKPK